MEKNTVVVPSNQLEVIVKETGLETTKAQFILDKFSEYFTIAAEWEAKAKTITVTNASQTADMQMARVGRLFLQKKRTDVEKMRILLKEDILREQEARQIAERERIALEAKMASLITCPKRGHTFSKGE